MANGNVVLMGVGEISLTEGPMESYSALARPTLATADIRFAQAERLYSERGTQKSAHLQGKRAHPRQASVFKDCGIDVVSVASNHGGEWGPDALLDTVEVMRSLGAQPIGAGKNLKEARKPAILEKNGIRIGFLGYCSILPEGSEATPDSPGIAPLRANTRYEARDYNPGVPPRVITTPYEDELAAMVDDIKALKPKVDAVVLSMHWGIHVYEKLIADYESIIAKAAIDAGVDLILGHHSHLTKAVEVYKGKVCFHGIGNFIAKKVISPEKAAHEEKKYGVKLDPEHPLQMFGPGCHRNIIAKAVFSKKGVEKVSCLPAMINQQCQPEVLRRGDPRFDDMVRYLEWASEDFDHRFTVEGDEIVVTT